MLPSLAELQQVLVLACFTCFTSAKVHVLTCEAQAREAAVAALRAEEVGKKKQGKKNVTFGC